MTRYRKIGNSAPIIFLLGVIILLLLLDSCDQIEFEPNELLYISTDDIRLVGDDQYELNGSVLNLGKEDISQYGFCWSDIENPTTDGPNIELGPRESIGTFKTVVSSLKLKTTYYVRAYAITARGTTYGNEENYHTPPPEIPSVITDIDGNQYNVVVIGSQAWMKENLKTTRYADGTAIPYVEDDSLWKTMELDEKAYCWYDNNPELEYNGGYYSWAAAMNGEASSKKNPSQIQGVCPDGWHIPSDSEWNQMHVQLGLNPNDANKVGFLGSRQAIGDKMKGYGSPLWQNLGGSWVNQSGFTALPVGRRSDNGVFTNFNTYTYFWSSTSFDEYEAWYRYLYGSRAVLRVHALKTNGLSVRCLMD